MSSSFFRDHGAALATMALWPPVTMGVSSLLHRRRMTAAAAAASASARSGVVSGATLRFYRRPAGAEVVVVESVVEWDNVWPQIEFHIKVRPFNLSPFLCLFFFCLPNAMAQRFNPFLLS